MWSGYEASLLSGTAHKQLTLFILHCKTLGHSVDHPRHLVELSHERWERGGRRERGREQSMNHILPQLSKTIILDVMQRHPLRRTHFSQYASPCFYHEYAGNTRSPWMSTRELISSAEWPHVKKKQKQKTVWERNDSHRRTIVVWERNVNFYLTCTIHGPISWHVYGSPHLPVTPAQLMRSGIGRNASCAVGDFA